MQFLVRLSLSSGSRPSTEAEGRDFIEQLAGGSHVETLHRASRNSEASWPAALKAALSRWRLLSMPVLR